MIFTQISKVTDLAKAVLAVMIGMLLALVILVVTVDQPSNSDIYERQEQILDNQAFILCLILYPIEDRTPEIVASCQAPAEDG